MDHFEVKLADLVGLSVAPVLINIRRLFVIKAHRRPLGAWNTDPGWLLRQSRVNRFVCRVDDYLRVRLALLQAGDTTYMIHVRVRAGDGLQLKAMLIDCLSDGI